jgi:hypothetical protein
MKKYIFISLLFISGCSYVNDAQTTIFNETKLSTSLKRYEWFKNAAAALEAKLSTLKAYEARKQSLMDQYEGQPRKEWAREDREQFNVWESEFVGIKASYNTLASEYNANMAKINYAYTNIGGLPYGADEPLPREFKEYINN